PLEQELEALTRARDPRVRAAALGDLARRTLATEQPAVTVASALLREQGRLFRADLDDPLAAFASFREALSLTPGHTVLAVELADIADQLNRGDLLEEVFDLCAETVGGAPNPLRREIVVRHAEVLARQGHVNDALAMLQVHPELAVSDPRVQAALTVLRARIGDGTTLAASFESEGERETGGAIARAQAFLRAAAIADGVLAQGERAEALMRRALAVAPAYRPAVEALAQKLRAGGRGAELASVFEAELAGAPAPAAGDRERRRALLEALVALCRDELRDPRRARVHQRQLVALAGQAAQQGPQGSQGSIDEPARVRALARLFDLDLLVAAGNTSGASAAETTADATAAVATLQALGEAAGDDTLAAALRGEAARLVTAHAHSDDDRRQARELYRQAMQDDPTDLSAAGLETLLADPAFPAEDRVQARADALAAELATAETRAAGGAVARALRFRLAAVLTAAGRGEGALTVLQPLRAGGDRFARAYCLDVARAAGRADWEARLLSEPLPEGERSPDEALALAEALERQGDEPAAAGRFREVLATSPTLDAALGALRCAAAVAGAPITELVSAFQAVATLSSDLPLLSAALRREGDFLAMAAGEAAGPLSASVRPGAAGAAAAPTDAVDEALWSWMVAVRANDAGAVGRALLALVRAADDRSGVLLPLLSRAAARARMGQPEDAQWVQALAWRESPDAPVLQQGLTDLPVPPPPAPELVGLSAARAARAAAAGGALGMALDIERAVDAEMGGRLGEALDGFGRVLAHDAECVEAIEGVRRIAQTAGDALGQARALARLATLAKGPRAVALFAESARQFEQAGQPAQAITLGWRVLEERPDDQEATTRLTALLTANLDAPERAADYERLLAHRLSLLPAGHADRVPLLLDRAGHRLHRRQDRIGAIADFKRILKIVPYHEEALAELSALAVAEPSPRDAARLLERYVAVARDAELAAQARLDLAASYETLQDAGRAVEILEHAAALTPADPRPRERLVDLLLRVSDWRGALGALRAWDQATTEPAAKAKLYLRIGALLRDQALDQSGAAQSFRLAADLDPLGDGARALVTLYESLGDAPGRARAIAREIAELRQALAGDPLDLARLQRLKEFLDREATAPAPPATSEAVAPVAQVLALLGEGAEPPDVPQTRRRLGAGLSATAFWDRLALPQTSGFLSEIWAVIAAAVAELHRPDGPAISRLGLSRQNRVAPGSEPRLGWVEAAAVALGVEGLSCYASPQPLGEQGDAGVVALELPDPVLVFDRSALAGGAGARFRFGRALGLLRQRATVLDRLGAGGESDDLRHLFLAAGAIAGASGGAGPGAAAPAATVKALGKVLSRKDRKTLTLQASRFAFEASDVEAWRRGTLGTADRLGLVISGDVAAAARVAANAHGVVVGATELRASSSAMELLRFALDVAYLELRVEAGGVAG
ncbi:MAG TPA: hypothetical protein VNO55_07490, partial [Polyangia bacterium]|nr:hypothetical protein [Polyangia bacterium]